MRRCIMAFVGIAALLFLTDLLTTQAPGPRADGAGQRPGPPDRPGARGPGRRPGRPGMPLIAALDADRDGELSADEIRAATAALNKLDRNDDGKLAAEEIGPPRGRFAGPRLGRPRGPTQQGPPRPNNQQEKKILSVLDDMDRNQRRGMMNVPVWDGRMLRLMAEAVGAKHVVEIGTSNGYSGIWFCLALRATGGKLTTYEINAHRASLARENFKRAGVDTIVTLVEGDAHQEVAKLKEPIDVVFIDADKEGYPEYLDKLLPLVRPGGLILAHNMNMRGSGIAEYLEAVTTSPDLETLLLEGSSLGVTLKKR